MQCHFQGEPGQKGSSHLSSHQDPHLAWQVHLRSRGKASSWGKHAGQHPGVPNVQLPFFTLPMSSHALQCKEKVPACADHVGCKTFPSPRLRAVGKNWLGLLECRARVLWTMLPAAPCAVHLSPSCLPRVPQVSLSPLELAPVCPVLPAGETFLKRLLCGSSHQWHLCSFLYT